MFLNVLLIHIHILYDSESKSYHIIQLYSIFGNVHESSDNLFPVTDGVHLMTHFMLSVT